jgi:hypothetical protein
MHGVLNRQLKGQAFIHVKQLTSGATMSVAILTMVGIISLRIEREGVCHKI